MQLMTTEAIKKLQKQTNHAIVAEDFELIEKLDKAAQDVSGITETERRLLSQPFVLCGIKFYPLTVAKSLWFAEKVEEWEIDGANQDSLLFWLLTLENTEAALDAYADRKDADKAVKRLSRKLHCTNDELIDVYHKCTGFTGESSGSCDTDYGGMIAILLREYGGTPEKWLYETSVEMIGALFAAYSAKVDAEQSAGRKSASRKGKAIAPPPSKRLAALSKFREVTNEILEVWNGE